VRDSTIVDAKLAKLSERLIRRAALYVASDPSTSGTFRPPAPWRDIHRRSSAMPRTVAHDARGRGASKLADIPTAGWKDILWRTYHEVVSDHVMLIAAGVAFYAMLALVPTLTALVSIYGLFADPATLNRHMDLLEGLIPAAASTSFASSFGAWLTRERPSSG